MSKKSRNKGFSLVELIVAITIMAIMTAFMVPSLLHMKDKAKLERDMALFESISVAFKKSMSEQEVKKEVDKLVVDGKISVVFKIAEDGYVDYNQGKLVGKETVPLKTSKIWLNTYQIVGTSNTIESRDFKNMFLVLDIYPKIPKTTAKCEYRIEKTFDF